jgi:hypothetical protein
MLRDASVTFQTAGKTTLINYILTEKHGKKIAVVENEFGELLASCMPAAARIILEPTTSCALCSSSHSLLCVFVSSDYPRQSTNTLDVASVTYNV